MVGTRKILVPTITIFDINLVTYIISALETHRFTLNYNNYSRSGEKNVLKNEP